MFKVRFAILGAAAVAALGTASALAMVGSSVGGDPDGHGDAVASAARNCPHFVSGVHGAHGKCVSAIASTGGTESQDNQESDQSAKVTACKAADTSEDKSETKPAKGDKAAKKADHTEDKSEHQNFAACVSGQSAAAEGS